MCPYIDLCITLSVTLYLSLSIMAMYEKQANHIEKLYNHFIVHHIEIEILKNVKRDLIFLPKQFFLSS